MALPPGFLDEIRSRISIAQVVGRKVSWDNRKSNPGRGDYWAPCPFHTEKSASFHVDDAKGYYYCFGCHAKGDAISFLRDSENMGFMEAVEVLARDAGLTMPERDPAEAARAAANTGLAEAMEAAIRFYRTQLNGARAVEARAYLDRRGLKAETIERFEIGFAPDSRTAIQEHLAAKGFSPDKLVEAGLVGQPQGGGTPYDRFRGRIMFPIRDARGRAIAFGARALLPDQQPKYLNSPETPLFDKGRSLYNSQAARAAAGRAGTVIVTEGYMDVIALAEAGFDHAVAPLGTAITEEQLRLIWRMAPEPVVALDGDRAGIAAAHRLISLALPLLEAGRGLRFAVMPAGQDPDDVIRAGGPEAMQALLDASVPAIDLIWSRATEGGVFDSPERRASLEAGFRAQLGTIADPTLRSHYQAEIRRRCAQLFTPPRWERKVRGPGRGSPRAPLGPRFPAAVDPTPSLRASPLARPGPGTEGEARIRESAILAGCLAHPGLAAEFEDSLERLSFACTDLDRIRSALLSGLQGSLSPEALHNSVARAIGSDPFETLLAPGQVRANRYLCAGGDPDLARRAIAEEIDRHAALSGRSAERRDAEKELSPETAESFGWRLRDAAETDHRTSTAPLADSANDSADEDGLSAQLQELIDREVWKKPRRT
jgi:DNA primase